jgi:hypothetical protein
MRHCISYSIYSVHIRFSAKIRIAIPKCKPFALIITIGEHKCITSKRMDILTYVLQVGDQMFYDKCMQT